MSSQSEQIEQRPLLAEHERICVTNAKGGTGKTTIAINLAGALSHQGHEVLFVDADPQGNATEGLGLQETYDAEPPTLFDAITDHTQRDVVNDLIVEHPEMDVLPSSVDLLEAEHELTIADLMARLKKSGNADATILSEFAINVTPDALRWPHAKNQLALALESVDPRYDYVIIDSPPFFGELTDNAMYAARQILIPALTEATSERAIELLFDQVAALEDITTIEIEDVGAVANRVEHTNEDLEMLEWLNAVFDDVPVWEIRKRVALQRAFSAGESIISYDPNCDMAEVFLDMAATLDASLTQQEADTV